ncbi:MAG: alpha-amylase family glycosyl hydrolase [Bacteroidales bacterium]|nr:alpha-amylase family glycosyl hydrolase [Bacteroidales bacterium]
MYSLKRLFGGLVGGLMALTGNAGTKAATAAPVDDPRALTIYQVMVASFRHGDEGAEGYTAMWGPDGHTKNGNLQGVIEALDHISSLGANAVWLTPIFDSSDAAGGEKLQATGYFTNDYFKIDPHFGTEADLHRLVDEAHKRGIAVILDGVFGHHGGVTTASPSGHMIDCTVRGCDRIDGGTGNVSYPGSLPYFKEVASYYIDKYGIDGWRLDQAYQAMQDGHNYWTELRGEVARASQARKDRGEQWGTLGYMVGEDWGNASRINEGVYRDGGLTSAFDFDGKERISGPMQDTIGEGLVNGYADIITTLSPPTARGYLNDSVMPNLFLSNHDGYRLADHFADNDSNRIAKMMMRHAILAAYSGPITLYYGDEYADLSRNTTGGQKDNVARTSGHLEPRNADEARLSEYVAHAMRMRAANPAMWRGEARFATVETTNGPALIVTKVDPDSPNVVAVIFSETDTTVPVALLGRQVDVKAYIPEIITVTGK